MDKKSYLQVTGAIFALAALAHLIRAVLDWPIVIAGWIVPVWLSWLAFLTSGTLSGFGWNLARRN